jgi:hypothetical protein
VIIRKPPFEEKMFYFQDVLRLPSMFISQKDVLSFQNITKCFKLRHPKDIFKTSFLLRGVS